MIDEHHSHVLAHICKTPERRQSKTLLTIDERRSKMARKQCFQLPFVGIRATKTLLLTIFDLRSSIVLTFSIAA